MTMPTDTQASAAERIHLAAQIGPERTRIEVIEAADGRCWFVEDGVRQPQPGKAVAFLAFHRRERELTAQWGEWPR